MAHFYIDKKYAFIFFFTLFFFYYCSAVVAGTQRYEPLVASVQATLHAAVSDKAAPEPYFNSYQEKIAWLTTMSSRLQKVIPHTKTRVDFLKTVHYESTRAGLDPQLVLALIEVESKFRKYAVSKAGAKGYMQVMPFWVKLIGKKEHNLFHLRTNLRYGCVILRHYLDGERGNLTRALARYNGSLGKTEYSNKVQTAWKNKWHYSWQSAALPNSLKMDLLLSQNYFRRTEEKFSDLSIGSKTPASLFL